jgi:multidrug resistance efflux pump
MLKKAVGISALGCLVALLAVSMAVAQPGGGGGGGGGRGNRGNFDPAQMREMMAQRMQENLGITAEEWKVLGPKIEKVQTLSREANAGGMGMFGRGMMGNRGNRGNRGGGMMGAQEGEETAVQKATAALQATLESPNPSTETIKQQLTALRQAKEKAKQELATAQADLRKVLSLPQEARCVLMGLLD